MAALKDAKDGSAALEFALIAPVLVVLFGGTVSFGVGLRVKMELGNAARAGAAYAAVHGYDQPAAIIAAARAATVLAGIDVDAAPPTTGCVNPTTGAISGASSTGTCPGTGARPGTYLTVTTQMSYTLIFPPPGMAGATTLGGKAVARVK